MADHILIIRKFIFENFLFSDSDNEDGELENDASFLDNGIIDSTGVLELVEWLEDEFDIVVDDDELVPENLDSVNNLNAFIIKKKS